MKKTIIAAAALVAMVSCNKSIIDSSNANSKFGYINLGVSAETEMVTTKGETPVYNDYTVTLKKDGVVEEGWPKVYSAITESDWKVPSGNYTVEVENISADAVYTKIEKGEALINGKKDVVVYPGIASPCHVECKVQNSKISFLYTEEFETVFQVETAATTVTDGDKSFSMDLTKAGADVTPSDAAFYNPGELTWTLVIKNRNGADGEEKTYTSKVTTKAAYWTHVTFSTGSTDGSINVTINVDGTITTETINAVLDPMGGDVTIQ